MSTHRRRRRWWELGTAFWLVVALLIVATPALLVGSLLFEFEARGMPYVLKADGRLGDSGSCVSATQSGTLWGNTGGFFAWKKATLVEPSTLVTVYDCASGKPAAVDDLKVGYSWAESGCELFVYSRNSDEPGYQPRSRKYWGTPYEARDSCPVTRVAYRSITTRGSVQRWAPGPLGDLQFRGWSWAGDMCLRPAVTVEARMSGQTHSTTLNPADACISRW